MTMFKKTYFGKKVIIFLAISPFLKAALDAQQSFMPTRYFFSIAFRSKVIAFFLSKSCQSLTH